MGNYLEHQHLKAEITILKEKYWGEFAHGNTVTQRAGAAVRHAACGLKGRERTVQLKVLNYNRPKAGTSGLQTI